MVAYAQRLDGDPEAWAVCGLLHDADYYSAPGSWLRTVASLPILLEELDSRGLEPIELRR